MTEIEETQLPGVGVRYDFVTDHGQRIGVVHHHGGRREVFFCPVDDPDTAVASLDLTEDEAHTLVEVLGVSKVIETLSQLQQVEGLAIDWIPVDPGSPYAGKTIGDARIRTRTGVSVVAAVRGKTPFPAPGPDFHIEPGDTLVVVGTAEGVKEVSSILEAG